MLNSQNNYQYKNISSNIEYQVPNDSRPNISFPYGDISSPEQKYSDLFTQILDLNSPLILNYLLIPELSILSSTNRTIKYIIEKYYSLRLKIEYEDIRNFEIINKDKNDEYLKIYEFQIPLSQNNWFNYDIQNAISTILALDRKTISQLRGIKKLRNLNENIYAPFCIIFNFNSNHEQVIKNGWKKVADNIISDSKFFINISNLKFENFEDEDMLEAFSYLNQIEYNIDKINRYSHSLLEMNIWCKAVVIYHMLVHPYKYRNIQNSIQINSQMYKYISFMNDLINKFYLFKGYLEIKKLIKPNLGEYIFILTPNNQNSVITSKEEQNQELISNINNEKIISNILTYLPFKESIKFISMSKFGFSCFKKSLNILCNIILKRMLLLKYYSYNMIYPILPIIFENNIFSNFFFMLEDIINPTINYKETGYITSFLSKENINDIKNYKGNNELIDSICKIFCLLLNIKVEKTFDSDYKLINLYIKSVILKAVRGELSKLIRYFNIFNLNNNQIKEFYEELSNIYSVDKINKVKNINKGFYQLLLWEIYLFEYIKQFNPFLFIDINNFLNNESISEDQINIINNYINMMDNLKYILNFKYHFDHLFFSKNKISSYDFISIILNIKKEFQNDSKYENINEIIKTFNTKHENISKAYFECKNLIENINKPSLFRRIMEELIILNVEIVNEEENINDINNSKKNNSSKNTDESFYIRNFLALNNINYNIKNSYNLNNNDNLFTFKENYSSNYFSPKNNKIKSKINKSNTKTNKKNKNFSYGTKNNKNNNNKIRNTFYSQNFNPYSPENKIILSQYFLNNDNSEIYNMHKTNKSYGFKNSESCFFNSNIYNSIIYEIPEKIIITKILFYLSIYDFPELSLVNKLFYRAIKTHIYIRLFFLEKKKNKIENLNNEIITRIDFKRNEFYKENNVSPPSLKNACYLFSLFNKNDVYELKSLFKKHKPEYEIIISVLCIFLNIKPKIFIDEEGKKIIDYFSPGKNLVYNKDFIKIIQNLDLDSISYQTFIKIEKIMQNEAFSIERINWFYSPCLKHLINLEMGVMEYFRAIRKYCLNFYDYYILNQDEINFCQKMDDILKIYYKIKNYTFNKCQKFHQKAKELLKKIDLEQNFEGEIQDFDNEILNENINNNKDNIMNENENNDMINIDNGSKINYNNINESNNVNIINNNDKNGQ